MDASDFWSDKLKGNFVPQHLLGTIHDPSCQEPAAAAKPIKKNAVVIRLATVNGKAVPAKADPRAA